MNISRFLHLQFFIAVVVLTTFKTAYSQEQVKPFTARAYWLEEQNKDYQSILIKIDQGINLAEDEEKYFDFYKDYLNGYFEKLSESEKQKYRVFKPQWDEEAELQADAEPSDVLEENAKGINPGKKYRLYNGLYGFTYGAMIIPVLGIEESNISIGLPFLLAGGSALLPVLNPSKYENMNYNSVLLNRHGKFYGLIDGATLGLLVFGADAENAYKGILATSIAGSIVLGEIGFQLGKKVDWTEGRIAGYTHYALVSPLFAIGLYASFVNTDNENLSERAFAGLILMSEAGGYLMANKLWKKFNYTRGDILATSSFSLLSAGLGIGIVGEVESGDDQKEILIPTLTLLAGSIGSHSILQGKNLTAREGWRVNYVTGAGVLLGLGTALAIQSENINTYVLLPTIGGFIGWGAMLSTASKRDLPDRNGSARLSYNFSPQNYYLNKNIPTSRFTPENPGASVLNLTLSF